MNVLLYSSYDQSEMRFYAIVGLVLLVISVMLIVTFFQMASDVRKSRLELQGLHEDIVNILREKKEGED